jgi:hypothetical protein
MSYHVWDYPWGTTRGDGIIWEALEDDGIIWERAEHGTVSEQADGGTVWETIDQRVLWDTAAIGDQLPDPGWPCGAEHPDHTQVCLRANGHRPGTRHVATADGRVTAVWTGDGTPVPVPDDPAAAAEAIRRVHAHTNWT